MVQQISVALWGKRCSSWLSHFISSFKRFRTLLLYNACASVSSSVERVECYIYTREGQLLKFSEHLFIYIRFLKKI